MTAPAYTWSFHCDLWGDRVPKVVTLEATTDLLTKVGTLVFMSSGQVDNAGDAASTLIGLAAEVISTAATAADPVKVALIAPGMVIKGTADADASTLSGFNGKLGDLNSDGSFDTADTTDGCLSVYRTEDSGITVYCTITEFDMGCVNS